MKKTFEFGIWGQFGFGQVADGQAVRTRIITNELINRYGKDKIKILSTYKWKARPFRFLFNSWALVSDSKSIIMFPADNGFRVFVPILRLFNFIYRRKIYYVVIGGFLTELLRKKKHYLFALKKYQGIFVQTNNMKNELLAMGLKHVFVIGNIKRLTAINTDELILNNEPEVAFCLLSRVTEQKGIIEAIEAIKIANGILKGNKIHLDIFGIIDPGFSDIFANLLKENISFVSYKGIIDFDKTVESIKTYFALIFPTYYHGEGFPGNFLDAFYAGLPIIATNWRYNSEILLNNVNGILVPVKDVQSLSVAILDLYFDREKVLVIRKNNLRESLKYDPDIILNEFYTCIEGK